MVRSHLRGQVGAALGLHQEAAVDHLGVPDGQRRSSVIGPTTTDQARSGEAGQRQECTKASGVDHRPSVGMTSVASVARAAVHVDEGDEVQDLDGKVAVVTGAASGIGRSMARAFVAQGMKVVMADIETGPLADSAASLEAEGSVATVRCDVSVAAEVEALRDAALDAFGAVHVVCNNAGVGSGGPAWEQPLSEWEWVLGVNLWGVIHGVHTFAPLLIAQGEGHIVNTASMAGLTSPPMMASYNVSKHAVVALSETLFSDLQVTGNSGVGVSVLCPGWVRTRIHESGRNRPTDAGGATDGLPVASASGLDMAGLIGGLIADGLDPDEVAGLVVDAVHHRRFYILTHDEWLPGVTARTERMVNGQDPAMLLPN